MTDSACLAFVATVEMLMARRRTEAGQDQPRRNSDWGPRTWTRAELEDSVYASYKPMRQGRVTRPPRREKVMEIADYLDCSLDERNALLIAAECAPIEVYLTGAALDEPVRIARDIAAKIRLPAIVINRDWRIHFVNEHVFMLSGTPPGAPIRVLAQGSNLLQLIFDPRSPLHQNLVRNEASFARMARQTIFAFKKANVLSRFEAWHHTLIAQLSDLPAFTGLWESVDIGLPTDEAAALSSPLVFEMLSDAVTEPLKLRPLLISVGYFQFDYPQVIVFSPADEASATLMHGLGISGL
jgi:MmyB-like transcription regulator ligand binding domain